MLKFLNKKKNDNKGFSLVELIIVVAIMAILVGLLAPQYLKYVEKSRKSSDASNLSEIVNAIQIYAADSESSLSAGDYKITMSDKGTTITAGKNAPKSDDITKVNTEVAKTAPDFGSTKTKSTKWDTGDGTTITATVSVDSEGGTSVTYTPDDLHTFIKGTGTTAAE